MSRHHVEVCCQSERVRKDVFALLADHDQLSRVFGVPCKRIKQGAQQPNGTGSVRRIGMGPVAIEETVTAFQESEYIEYRISKGGWPLSQHRGELRFTEHQGHTQVVWSIDFAAPLSWLGHMIAATLEQGISRGLRKALQGR